MNGILTSVLEVLHVGPVGVGLAGIEAAEVQPPLLGKRGVARQKEERRHPLGAVVRVRGQREAPAEHATK
eukprot:168036-Prorocentrum_minimum.AAC.1